MDGAIPRRRNPLRGRGFTLIELLVVIAIIGVLIGPAAAGGAGGAGVGPADAVRQQSEADRPGAGQLRVGPRRLPAVVCRRPEGRRVGLRRQLPGRGDQHAAGVRLGDADPALPGAVAALRELQHQPAVLGAGQHHGGPDEARTSSSAPTPWAAATASRPTGTPTATRTTRTTAGPFTRDLSCPTAITSPTPGSTSRGGGARSIPTTWTCPSRSPACRPTSSPGRSTRTRTRGWPT